ncbi:MAG: HEPN domain-containing protein [Magnetococcales bacterium]|nr:HEPN domain-containing protein [Magnetococcales bacterium]
MKGIDYARELLRLARADHRAMTGMRDHEVFTDAIFGFHAQQAVEKGLKAWLSALEILFPLTHDISRLLPLLEQQSVEKDLLAEPLVELVLGFLQLGAVKRGGPQWRHCHDLLLLLRSVDPDDDKETHRLQDELGRFQVSLNSQMQTLPTNLVEITILVRLILDFAPESALISAVPQYCQGDWYVNVRNACCTLLLDSCRDTGSWTNVFERFLGVNSVPLMTIHKSKGLEFHTVLFVGLDDSAFWKMHKDRDEGLLAFFVAFSRARDRAFITYCHQRGNRQKVREIYDILASAGVPTICQNQVQGDH